MADIDTANRLRRAAAFLRWPPRAAPPLEASPGATVIDVDDKASDGQPPESPSLPETALGRRWQRFGWLYAFIWLFYLIEPLQHVLRHPAGPAKITALVALVAFSLGYVYAFRTGRRWRRRGLYQASLPQSWAGLALLVVFVGLMVPAAGESAMTAGVYIATAATVLLPARLAFISVGVLVAAIIFLQQTVPGWTFDGGLFFAIFAATFAVWGIGKLMERQAQLLVAHEEIARLAVAEERARTARDLHDILGHSLTVITVKAELAGRLLEVDSTRAGNEIADLERLAREALADVRSTIGGYREMTLATELASARSALSSAGIAAEIPTVIDDIPDDRRELFSWAVREGVTNVVRHSHARHCTIRLAPESVEVIDDGDGPTPEAQSENGSKQVGGHGLLGLSERAHRAGARMTIGRAAGAGGFALRVRVSPHAAEVPSALTPDAEGDR